MENTSSGSGVSYTNPQADNSFKKLWNFITSANHRKLVGLFILVVLFGAILLTISLSQQRQDIRQRAAEPEPISSIVNCQVNILASAAQGAGAVSTLELGNSVWVDTQWRNRVKTGDLYGRTNYCAQSITGLSNMTSKCIDAGSTSINNDYAWKHRDQNSDGLSNLAAVWSPKAAGTYKVFCTAAAPTGTGSTWEECRPPELSQPPYKSCSGGSITTLTVRDTVKPTATITASKTSGFINGETVTLTFAGTDNTGGSGVGILHTMIVEGVSSIEEAVASGKWTTSNSTTYKGVTGSTTTRTATVPFYAEVTAEDKAKYDETNTKYAGGDGNISNPAKFAAPAANCRLGNVPTTVTAGTPVTFTATFSSTPNTSYGEIDVFTSNGTGNTPISWGNSYGSFSGNAQFINSGSKTSGSLTWTPTVPGTYNVACRAHNNSGDECRAPGISWIPGGSSIKGQCSNQSSGGINVLAAPAAPTATPTPTPVSASGALNVSPNPCNIPTETGSCNVNVTANANYGWKVYSNGTEIFSGNANASQTLGQTLVRNASNTSVRFDLRRSGYTNNLQTVIVPLNYVPPAATVTPTTDATGMIYLDNDRNEQWDGGTTDRVGPAGSVIKFKSGSTVIAQTTLTSSNGYWTISSIPYGNYTLELTLPSGYSGYTIVNNNRSITIPGGRQTGGHFAVQPPAATATPTLTPTPTTITYHRSDVNRSGCVSIIDAQEILYAIRNLSPRASTYVVNVNQSADGIVDILDLNMWFNDIRTSGTPVCPFDQN